MTAKLLAFTLPGALGSLAIMPGVLEHFEAHRQRRWLSREAGGQLFATFDGQYTVSIVEATGPRATDKRSLFRYSPDRVAEKIEIAERFANGLHFVGDWHTHYEKVPEPSTTDRQSMQDVVRLSSHGLVGFVLVVVGQASFPEGLYVSFHSSSSTSSPLAVIDADHSSPLEYSEQLHGS